MVINGAWEEVQLQGSILVVCRRRLPRKETSAGDRKAELRRIQTLRDRLEAYKYRKRNETFEAESSSLSSDPESTDEESSENDVLSSPAEDWSEASSNDEQESSGDDTFSQASEKVSSSDEIASLKNMASDDELGSDDLGHSSDSDFDVDSEIESDLSDSGFDEDSNIESDSSDAEEAPITQVERQDSLMSYPVEITQNTEDIHCDWCWKKCPIRWYHCTQCVSNDFNLCHACVRHGTWCLDKTHQLFEMNQVGTLGVISSICFKLRQELKVFDINTGALQPLYHFSMKYGTMLHDSPVAIHPYHSLVVWPLSGSQLLFADYKANSFFEQKITTGLGRSEYTTVLSSPEAW
jgi:hypothetical protein